MISVLLVSKIKEIREAYAAQICSELHIDLFDRTTFQPATSLGIEDVREIQKKALFKPLKSSEKALIVYDAHLATTEAQNALLKLLEEPPANTRIILTASSTRPFLSTILSRCKIIELDTPTEISTPQQEKMIDALIDAQIGEKLVFAQNLAKNKEDSLTQLEALVFAAHKKMQEHPNTPSYARLTQLLSSAYTQAANTNINLRFLVEHALLTMEQESEEYTS